MLDDYSRKLLDWNLGTTMRVEDVTERIEIGEDEVAITINSCGLELEPGYLDPAAGDVAHERMSA